MLGAVSCGILDFLADICNLYGHVDVAGLGLVVPLQGESELELSIPF